MDMSAVIAPTSRDLMLDRLDLNIRLARRAQNQLGDCINVLNLVANFAEKHGEQWMADMAREAVADALPVRWERTL